MYHLFDQYTGSSLLLLTIALLNGCSSSTDEEIEVPSSFTVSSGPPEDITADGSTAFVSSLADGSITKLDLANEGRASELVAPAKDIYSAGWGLRILRKKNWLLNVQNQPYDFNPEHAQAGRLAAFDLTTGKKLKTWDFPEQTVGNSVDVDEAGNIYVGDIGPNARILKIDGESDEVSVWATSEEWVNGGFGVGGMVFNGAGLYAAHDNALWYVALAADGQAAAPARVSIAGDPVIFADGMALVGGDIMYAENDVLVAGAQGVLYRVELTSATTAKRTTVREGLQDPSGVTVAQIGEQSYLLVNESQLGFLLGVDEGKPRAPYQIEVLPL